MTLNLVPTDDKKYSLNLIISSMTIYFNKYGISINEDSFEENWLNFENFEILNNGIKVGIVRYDKDHEFCNIRDIHIETQYQGQGIGSSVIKQIVKEMRDESLQSVRLKVFKDNPANGLYRRLGFKVVGEDNNLVLMMLNLAQI